jgi:hydrogenase expression/formation protein HypC
MCLGIPGLIISITDGPRKLAMADISGVKREVNIACILGDRTPQDCIGDWVLIHVGFAMSRIDEEEVAEMLRIFEELGEVQQELAAMQASRQS